MKIRFPFLFTLLLVPLIVSAKIDDDAFKALRSELNAANRISPQAGIEKADEILEAYKGQLSAGQEVRIHYVKSWSQVNTDRIEGAFETLAHARMLARDVEEPAILYSYYSISASAFSNMELYQLALENHQKAYELAPLLNLPGFIGQTENNIGHVYLKLGLLDEAEAHFQKFLESSEERGWQGAIGTALNNLGEVAYERGDYALALQHHERAMQIRKDQNLEFHQGWSLYNLGRVAAATGKLEEAKVYLNDAIALWLSKNANSKALSPKLALAGVYFEEESYTQALTTLADIFHVSFQLNLLFPTRDALDLQRQINKAQNDLSAALEATERYIEVTDSILARQESIGLTYTVLSTELQTKELALVELEHEKNVALTKADAEQQQRTILLISALVVLAVTIIFTVRLNRRKQKLIETVEQLHDTRAQLVESETMQGMTTLVSGMAHQLNTPLGLILTANSTLESHLSTLKDNLEKRQITQKRLEQFFADADELLQLTHNSSEKTAGMVRQFKMLSANLEKSELSRFCLLEFLQKQMASLEVVKDSPVKINISGQEVETKNYISVLLKVMSQLIENSIKHGLLENDNPEINIELTILPNEKIQLDYRDNGKGIATENLSKVFTPFYTSRLGEGNLGLGLNIVYNSVVHLMKGQIECVACEEGAHFVIVLPVEVRDPTVEAAA